jgi:pSer/pThr/pTyr-binding forkhead associated (FHA) protein
MVVTLRVLVGPELERQIAISSPRFTIGRAEDCDLRPNCPLVSRHHCELIVEGPCVSIRDSRSKNGTYVNGQRVADEQELHSGDLVGVGLRRLAVWIEPDAVALADQSVMKPAGLHAGERSDASQEELSAGLPWTPA